MKVTNVGFEKRVIFVYTVAMELEIIEVKREVDGILIMDETEIESLCWREIPKPELVLGKKGAVSIASVGGGMPIHEDEYYPFELEHPPVIQCRKCDGRAYDLDDKIDCENCGVILKPCPST